MCALDMIKEDINIANNIIHAFTFLGKRLACIRVVDPGLLVGSYSEKFESGSGSDLNIMIELNSILSLNIEKKR